MKLKSIVAQGFPGYKGRHLYLRKFSGPHGTSSYWSGGGINYYIIVNLATGELTHPPTGSYPWCREQDKGQVESLTDDECLLNESIMRGKPFSVTVYCTPECKEKHGIEENWTE